jgi:ubiquinone/menaquinone biosynthesis C-methylase UbiE
MKSFILGLIGTIFINIFLSQLSFAQSWRDRKVQPEKIMDAVGIKPGMVIGEAGAGKGYFTFWLSKRIGEKGKLYANDIQENVLKVIEDRCKREGVKNITTVLGEASDPLYPVRDLEMIISLITIHEMTRPVEWLINAQKYMKPNALMVIVEGANWDYMPEEKVLGFGKSAGLAFIKIARVTPFYNIYVFRNPKNNSES